MIPEASGVTDANGSSKNIEYLGTQQGKMLLGLRQLINAMQQPGARMAAKAMLQQSNSEQNPPAPGNSSFEVQKAGSVTAGA